MRQEVDEAVEPRLLCAAYMWRQHRRAQDTWMLQTRGSPARRAWKGKMFCVMGRPSSASRVCSSSSSIAAWPAPLAACGAQQRHARVTGADLFWIWWRTADSLARLQVRCRALCPRV